MSRFSVFGYTPSRSSGPVLALPQGHERENGIIQIHEDSPQFVQAVYAQHRELRLHYIETPISENLSPTYEQIRPSGRSEAYMSYGGGENRTISLDLVFADSALEGDDGQHGQALMCARWLQSLMLPVYDANGIQYPPALCRLILGRTIRCRGVVTQATPQFEQFSSRRSSTASRFTRELFTQSDQSVHDYPLIVKVSLEFTVVNVRAPDARMFLPGRRVPFV